MFSKGYCKVSRRPSRLSLETPFWAWSRLWALDPNFFSGYTRVWIPANFCVKWPLIIGQRPRSLPLSKHKKFPYNILYGDVRLTKAIRTWPLVCINRLARFKFYFIRNLQLWLKFYAALWVQNTTEDIPLRVNLHQQVRVKFYCEMQFLNYPLDVQVWLCLCKSQ